MDNVMNRPLFQRYAKNRPATDAMYELSGIMRSSPELMEAVQKFQVGGIVRAAGQNLPRRVGTDVVTGAAPQAAGRAAPQAVPPGTFTSRPNMPPRSVQNIREQNIGRVMRTAPIVAGGAAAASMLDGEPVDVTADISAVDVASTAGEPWSPSAMSRMMRSTGVSEQGQERAEDIVRRAQEDADKVLNSPEASRAAVSQLDAVAAENPEIDPLKNVVLAAADQNKTDQERAAAALAAAGREVPSGTKGLIEAYKAMIQDAYGVNVERENRLSGLNKALIGFTIASGDDPRALVNISKGLAAGAQMLKEQEAADQKREDRIADLAVQQAFAERTAQLRAEYGQKTGDYTPERLRQRAIEAILKDPGEFNVYNEETGQVDPAKVQREANTLVQAMMAAGPAGGSGPAEGATGGIDDLLGEYGFN